MLYVGGSQPASPANSVTLTGTFNVGDLIVFAAEIGGLPGSGITGTVVFTDGLNTGNYTLLENFIEPSAGRQYFGGYIVVNTPGTTLTIASTQVTSSGGTGFVLAAHYNGFVGTPTAAGDANVTVHTSSSNTAVAATSFNTSKSNELVFAVTGNAAGSPVAFSAAPASPWVNESTPAGNLAALFDQIVPTSGTSIGLTGTLSSSQPWWVIQMGFYDAVAAGAALAGSAGGVATVSASLTVGVKLASAAAGKATVSASLRTGFPAALAAAASGTASVAGALTTGSFGSAAAGGKASVSGAFTNFASVTLAGTLYTGIGGVLDPNLVWPFSAPIVGSVVLYDPTFITIAANGEISSTSNNCSAVVQFFDGTNWNVVTVVITPNLVTYAGGRATVTATLSTVIGWNAKASGVASVTAALTTGVRLSTAAGGRATVTASLTSFIAWWSGSANLVVSTITSVGAIANWTAASYGGVTGYKLRLTPLGFGSTIIDTLSASPSYVLAGLSPGTTYEVEVAAYDGVGDLSPYQSSTATFTTLSSTGAARMTPQYVFGPGIGWITPLTDAGGNAIAVPAPILVAAMQDINLDMSAELKELYGSNSYAIAIGRGKQKMGAKIKNAQVHGRLWNNLFFGQTLTPGIYDAVFDTVGTVLSTASVTPAVPGTGTWGYNLGVRDVNNLPLQRVASGPSAGQYAVSAGVYTFAAADVSASVKVFIDFNYTATSTVAQSMLITNQPMGNAPTFQFDLKIPFQGNVFNLTLFSCVATKAGMSTKLDDFTMPEFDFSAQAPGQANIGRLSWSQ